MSMEVVYSVEPRRTSGGRYHRVTTSFEYVFVGIDFARAKPATNHTPANVVNDLKTKNAKTRVNYRSRPT